MTARAGRLVAALGLWLAAAGSVAASDEAAPPVSGETVFDQHCARCHGDEGQGLIGPAIIGSQAWLSNYGSGAGLYDYVRATMPQDRPGSLSSEEYLAVVTYLLKRNDFVSPGSPLTRSELDSVTLESAPAKGSE